MNLSDLIAIRREQRDKTLLGSITKISPNFYEEAYNYITSLKTELDKLEEVSINNRDFELIRTKRRELTNALTEFTYIHDLRQYMIFRNTKYSFSKTVKDNWFKPVFSVDEIMLKKDLTEEEQELQTDISNALKKHHERIYDKFEQKDINRTEEEKERVESDGVK